MGCSNGKSLDKKENNLNKESLKQLFYPKCINTYPANKQVLCMLPIDSSRVLLGIDCEIKILDFASKYPTCLFTEHEGCINVLLRLSNGLFASASQDKSIKVWDMNVPRSKATLIGHKSTIWTMCEITKLDNTIKIASGGDDKQVIIWNIEENKLESVLVIETSAISSIKELKCMEHHLIISTTEGKMAIWDIVERIQIIAVNVECCVWVFYEFEEEEKLICGMGNGDLQIRRIRDCMLIQTISAHETSVGCICKIGHDRLITGSDDENMILWNLKDLDENIILKGHKMGISGIAKVDSIRFASCSLDSTIKLWE